MSYSRGQRLVAYPDDVPPRRVYIEVTRCARDGSWVDVACHTWAVRWTRRIPTAALDQAATPLDWTMETLAEQMAEHERAFFQQLSVTYAPTGMSRDDVHDRRMLAYDAQDYPGGVPGG